MEKYKLVEKAWKINFSKIEEGYLYDPSFFIAYAETRNKAKSILLDKAYCENICLEGEEDECTYMTLPVIRYKEADKYLFEDKHLTLWQIEEKIHEKKRLDKLEEILKDGSVSHYYIKKGGYYRPGGAGYTDFKSRAGIFTKEEAVSSAKSCRDLTIIPIVVEEHNIMITEEINELKTRLI